MNRVRGAFVAELTFAWLLGCVTPTLGQPGEVPKSPFLGVVYKYADTLIKDGRGTDGPDKSPLFLGALDRQTLKPLATRPAAPAGVREDQRVGGVSGPLAGSNPQHDQNLLRLMYILKGLSQQDRYPQAADEEIGWFFTHPPTGEALLRPWVLWDRGCALASDQTVRFASVLVERELARPGDVRQKGFAIRACAGAYACRKEDQFPKGIARLLEQCEGLRHAATGLIADEAGGAQASMGPLLSLAIDCEAAAGLVPEPLASGLRAAAARSDVAFCSLPHDLAGTRRFITRAAVATGASAGGDGDPLWDPIHHAETTAAIGMMCVARYEHVGAVAYRKLITGAADAYLKSLPAADVDAWPLTFGQAISLELAAWRATARPAYFERARELGQLAVELFWQDNALPRASLKSQHYESITGSDTLATALLELHLSILHITAVAPPFNTIDR